MKRIIVFILVISMVWVGYIHTRGNQLGVDGMADACFVDMQNNPSLLCD